MTTPSSTGLAVPGRVLAVGAHPDDIEFGCGATLARWAAQGSHVTLLVLTDGSKGTWDAGADLDALRAERAAEQRRAADALGAADVVMLGEPDGELEATLELRARVCAAIRTARPDVVAGHDPWKRYRLHPDHLAAGRLAIDGVVAARDAHFYPGEGGPPHRPRALVLFEAEVVDHVEPIERDDVERKVEALLRHRSQWRSTMSIDAEDPEPGRAAFAGTIFGEARSAGRSVGVAFGEPFKLVTAL